MGTLCSYTGRFDKTVRGILNLKRAGVRVELRVIIQQANFEQLPALAELIVRNLGFLDHVALMGIEPNGFAKANLGTVWIAPVDYQVQLKRAVRTLSNARMQVYIYNHQLCTIERDLNEYLDSCGECAVKHRLCGFFSSGVPVHSRSIAAMTE